MDNSNYLSTDVFSLPSVTLQNYRLLPSLSGIYFLRTSSQIWYIGLSKNIHTRWHSHHILEKIENYNEEFFISWLSYTGDLLSLEQEFIAKYKPYLNITGNPDVDINYISRVERQKLGVNKQSERKSTQNKIRIRKSTANDLEVIANKLGMKSIDLLHVILESWVIDYKTQTIKEKN